MSSQPPTARELLDLDPSEGARRRWAWGQETYGDYDRDGFEDAYEEGLDMHGYLEAMVRRRDHREEDARLLLDDLLPILARLRDICREGA